MKNRVQELSMQAEARNIERCMEDPAYAAKVNSGVWCAACDMSRPCLCDRDAAVAEMRVFYEANRRTLTRAEPVSIGSWGRKFDALMIGLYKIATKPPR